MSANSSASSDLDKRLKELGLDTNNPPPPPPAPSSSLKAQKQNSNRKINSFVQAELEPLLEKERAHIMAAVTQATAKAFDNVSLSFGNKLDHAIELANYSAEVTHKMSGAIQGLYAGLEKLSLEVKMGMEEIKGELEKVKLILPQGSHQVSVAPPPPSNAGASLANIPVPSTSWFSGSANNGAQGNGNGNRQFGWNRRRRFPRNNNVGRRWSPGPKKFRRY